MLIEKELEASMRALLRKVMICNVVALPAIAFSVQPATAEALGEAIDRVVTDLIGLSRVVSRGARFNCKECGATHVFSAGSAWLSLTQPTAVPPSRRTGRNAGSS
jgi:hypothetical protein